MRVVSYGMYMETYELARSAYRGVEWVGNGGREIKRIDETALIVAFGERFADDAELRRYKVIKFSFVFGEIPGENWKISHVILLVFRIRYIHFHFMFAHF